MPISRFLTTRSHRTIQSHAALYGRLVGGRLSQAAPARDHVHGASNENHRESHRKQETNGKPSGGLGRKVAITALGVATGYTLATFYTGSAAETSPNAFINYRLASKDEISSTSAIFTVTPSSSAAINLSNVPERAITSVEFKQPQLQIARSYTLLRPVADQDSNELRFYIRKEVRGEVSGYLHRLAVGSLMDFRGPYIDYIFPPDVKEVVFLAGGTGIVPAVQVASALSQEAKVHVLWANRRREDCVGGESSTLVKLSTWDTISSWWKTRHHAIEEQPVAGLSAPQGSIVGLLDQLKRAANASEPASGHQLSVDYFVDEEGTFIQPHRVQSLISTSDNAVGGRSVLLVSGPEGFVDHWAGPKQWINGREVQGPLGGALAKLDTAGWEIVKL